MSIKTVSTTLPTDYGVQQGAIDRNRKLAEALRTQALAPEQGGEMVSGWYVPKSPLSQISKLVNLLSSKKQLEGIDRQESDLSQNIKQDRMSTLQNYQDMLTGKPGAPAQPEPTMPMGSGGYQDQIPQEKTPAMPLGSGGYGFDQEQDPLMKALMGKRELAPAQAAQAPDKRGAMMALIGSQDPMLQKFGMEQMMADSKPTQLFNKVDPKDHTPESIAKFAQTGNYADLVTVHKKENIHGVWQDPYAQSENAIAPSDPNKPFTIGPDGKPIPNSAYQAYEMEKTKKGATNVNVRTDVKMNEGLAKEVGPMMKDSVAKAEAASAQIDSANRVMSAMNNGAVFTGPTASTRMKIAQIGSMLGVEGKTNDEKIANTRQVIRGFAEMTLQGRQSMHGQGAISNNESNLAEKAASGNIDELTPGEIKILASAATRSGKFVLQEHNRKLQQMQNTPGLEKVAPFYQVNTNNIPMDNKPAPPGNVMHFDANGNPL